MCITQLLLGDDQNRLTCLCVCSFKQPRQACWSGEISGSISQKNDDDVTCMVNVNCELFRESVLALYLRAGFSFSTTFAV
ncbi:hypothetical protein PoB_002827900 [Plakobranchus ocellatus]|uniref:Uncharacterized protein n=1 Tax=Plakobranchus ocellatus TaxID=259542 RepID=A0AAV4A2C8_9GAST|nr:hypothetical protein PoB_002827900 [Plakobranchus ocellatus]